MKTTKKLIFKLRLNYNSIQNMIEWQKPLYEIEKRIEKCLLDIEMAMRLTRMTEAEAKEELCRAMDLIEKLTNRACDMLQDARAEAYYP